MHGARNLLGARAPSLRVGQDENGCHDQPFLVGIASKLASYARYTTNESTKG